MTIRETQLIQDLRLEMQASFRDLNDSITALTAGQQAHLAAHDERDRAAKAASEMVKERGVTKRWVIQVVVAACGVLLTGISISLAAVRLFIGV